MAIFLFGFRPENERERERIKGEQIRPSHLFSMHFFCHFTEGENGREKKRRIKTRDRKRKKKN